MSNFNFYWCAGSGNGHVTVDRKKLMVMSAKQTFSQQQIRVQLLKKSYLDIFHLKYSKNKKFNLIFDLKAFKRNYSNSLKASELFNFWFQNGDKWLIKRFFMNNLSIFVDVYDDKRKLPNHQFISSQWRVVASPALQSRSNASNYHPYHIIPFTEQTHYIIEHNVFITHRLLLN